MFHKHFTKYVFVCSESAVRNTTGKDVESAMEWLLSHEDDVMEETEPDRVQPPTEQQPDESAAESNLVAKSIKCEDCGKLFKSQTEVEFHSAKTGRTT